MKDNQNREGLESMFTDGPQTSWFVVCDTDLRDLLRRAQAGESPDLLLIEFYANTEADDQ